MEFLLLDIQLVLLKILHNLIIFKVLSGIVTGISTTMNGGNLAIEFSIVDDKVKSLNSSPFVGLATGYPIYIYDTQVGGGVTSINNSDSEVVGIGTTCVDNVYYISEWTYSSLNVSILRGNFDL